MPTDLHSQLLVRLDDYAATAEGDGYALAAAPLAALRAVVELHEPRERVALRGLPGELHWLECTGCRDDAPSWPCSTIQAIADQLGLTEGTDRRD